MQDLGPSEEVTDDLGRHIQGHVMLKTPTEPPPAGRRSVVRPWLNDR